MNLVRSVTIVVLTVCGLSAASAQVPQAQPSPEAQAMGQKLLSEINGGIQCNAAVITLQQQSTALRTESAAQKTAADKAAETAKATEAKLTKDLADARAANVEIKKHEQELIGQLAAHTTATAPTPPPVPAVINLPTAPAPAPK